MVGPDRFEFIQEARQGGRWGEPAGGDAFGGWWSFPHMWGLLSPDRRAQLEALAGVPLEAVA